MVPCLCRTRFNLELSTKKNHILHDISFTLKWHLLYLVKINVRLFCPLKEMSQEFHCMLPSVLHGQTPRSFLNFMNLLTCYIPVKPDVWTHTNAFVHTKVGNLLQRLKATNLWTWRNKIRATSSLKNDHILIKENLCTITDFKIGILFRVLRYVFASSRSLDYFVYIWNHTAFTNKFKLLSLCKLTSYLSVSHTVWFYWMDRFTCHCIIKLK